MLRITGVLLVVILLGTAGLANPNDDDDTTIIRLVSTCTAINNFVDVGPPGPSPGDIYVFVDELFTVDHSRKVGTATGRCNLVNPAQGSFECTTISSFATGTITTDGILYNAPGVVSVGAVTGGTGRYRGAKGEASVDLG